MRAAKVQAILRICAVWPEPSLLAHIRSESRGTLRQKARSLAPLNGWACAVKICHDGMLEDTNSLDGAHVMLPTLLYLWNLIAHWAKIKFTTLRLSNFIGLYLTWKQPNVSKNINNRFSSNRQTVSWIPKNCTDQTFILSGNINNHDQKKKVQFCLCVTWFSQDLTTILDFISYDCVRSDPVSRLDANPTGIQEVAGLILRSGNILLWILVNRSWNHFNGHSLPTADSSRTVVSYW